MSQFNYFSDIDVIKSKEELEAQLKGWTEHEDGITSMLDVVREQFQKGGVGRIDVGTVERVLSQARSKKEIIEQKIKTATPAAQIKLAATNIDTAELLRTSLIRFGGVAVILFLISILVPIYRYNVRLSTYYLARADALLLCKDIVVDNFGELLMLLTPTHAFEKEPQHLLNR